MVRLFFLALVLVGIVVGLELNGIKAMVKGDSLIVNGKSYKLAKDVIVESPTGERLGVDVLQHARTIKVEFNQANEAKHIKILGWWD